MAVAVKGASIPVTEDPAGSVSVGMSHTWRYDTQTEATHILPNAWAGVCNTGTKQSPIDVVSTAVSIPSPDPGMVMSHLWEMDITGDLYNTDRHITYQITQNLKPFISGGPLTSTSNYVFDHMDFHFGSTDTQGSEHTMDGTQYPMEIQLVFYDGQFSDIHVAGASANVDALATISYFVEVDSTDNADLKNIVDKLSSIAAPTRRKKRSAKKARNAMKARSTIDVAKSNLEQGVQIDLSKIFGLNVEDYYYYDGSMTSPNCTENVRWIISSKKLKISSTQLAEFRALQGANLSGARDNIQDNFRPVQSLGSRTVNRRMKTFQIDPVAAQVFVSSITGAAVFHNLYNYLQQPEIAKAFSENPVADFFNNIPEIFQGEQEVVQQRSAQEYQQQQAVYQQAVYQPQQYQQYLSPPQPAPVPVQA